MLSRLLISAVLLAAQEVAAKDNTLSNTPASEGYSLFTICVVLVCIGIFAKYGLVAGKRTVEFVVSLGASKKRLDGTRIDIYNHLQDDQKTEVESRESDYANLVNTYYDLATEFYEWGWGTSFHFANQLKGENFHSSILRHEHFIAGRLNVKKGDKILDCGCGIGGPARNIARFTGAEVTAISINQFQVDRGNALCKKQGMADQVKLVQGDFMKLPFPDNSFDAVYAIEATCHAPERNGVYSEIYRVLKPGGSFATYEWCLTDKYDKNNAIHRKIKKDIEVGDGLPDMVHTSVCTKALRTVGFEIVEARDCALDDTYGGKPWYYPLTPSWNPFHQPGFQFCPPMRKALPAVLGLLEKIGVVPSGTGQTQVMLQAGGEGCEQGGQTGVFTPMWLMVGQKKDKN